jgi:hypothetical protein
MLNSAIKVPDIWHGISNTFDLKLNDKWVNVDVKQLKNRPQAMSNN